MKMSQSSKKLATCAYAISNFVMIFLENYNVVFFFSSRETNHVHAIFSVAFFEIDNKIFVSNDDKSITIFEKLNENTFFSKQFCESLCRSKFVIVVFTLFMKMWIKISLILIWKSTFSSKIHFRFWYNIFRFVDKFFVIEIFNAHFCRRFHMTNRRWNESLCFHRRFLTFCQVKYFFNVND